MKKIYMHILDEIPELVYMSDMETYDLLYVNKSLCNAYQTLTQESVGKCYKLLQNRDSPCPFCNNELLAQNTMLTWRHFNDVLKRQYQVSDIMTSVDSRPVRVQISTDITSTLAQEKLISACVRVLYASEDVETALEEVLSMVGRHLEADRAYIFESDGDYMKNTYEWRRLGLSSRKETLQHLPVATFSNWTETFNRNEIIDIPTLENIRESCPQEYEALRIYEDLRSLLVVPLRHTGDLVLGCLGVENYRVDFLGDASMLLQSLEYFIASSLRLRDSQLRLQQMSYFDQLTGLRNRKGFTHDFPNKKFKDIGLAFLDVNGLKDINASEGAMRGDILLQQVTRLLREIFPDAKSYRMGGDEFAIVWTNISRQRHTENMNKLIGTFSGICGFSASVGGEWMANGNPNSLLELADINMSEVKKSFYREHPSGRRYRHSSDLVADLSRPGRMEQLMREGAFVTYWQPKYSVATGKLAGSEVLVRMFNEKGLVPPDLFIPVLEVTHMISQLDLFVFEQTCRQFRYWLDIGFPVVPASTNFSCNTMEEPNFVDELDDIRQRYNVPFSLLEVEITERVGASDREYFRKVAVELKNRGFQIAIDDFGIQHANLRLLMDVDSDVIKLDRCLIQHLQDSPKVCQVLEAFFNLCRTMGVHTVIEGVETQEELAILRKMNCDYIQGYVFSKPIPLSDFEKLVQRDADY